MGKDKRAVNAVKNPQKSKNIEIQSTQMVLKQPKRGVDPTMTQTIVQKPKLITVSKKPKAKVPIQTPKSQPTKF